MLNWTHINTIQRELDLSNCDVNEAWNDIMIRLTTPYMGDAPPDARARLQHEATKLTQISNKTGFEKLFY